MMRTVPRRTSGVLLPVMTITAMVLLFVGGAQASHIPGSGTIAGFEVDGNLTFDGHAGASHDWATVGGATMTPDASASQADDVFGGGNKEEDPDGWTFTAGPKPPAKADLTRAYLAAEISDTSAALWLAFERLEAQGRGDVHIAFEINRSAGTTVNGEGTTIPTRSPGDLLVAYDYPGGEKPVEVRAFTWDGTTLAGTWHPIDLPAGSASADINGDTVSRPAAAPFGGGSVAAFRFGEAGLDLRAVFGTDAASCPGFRSFWVKSRASGESINAQLKDVIAPTRVDVSNCGNIAALKTDGDGVPLASATFALWADEDGDAVRAPDDALIATSVSDADGTVTFTDIAPGDYVLTETSAPAGYRLDPTEAPVRVIARATTTVEHVFVNTALTAGVSLVKTADPVSGVPGTPVTYRYLVTNTGETTLIDVLVDDDVLGHVGDLTSLAPGASHTFTMATVLPSDEGSLTNVGTVVAVDELGREVTASDDATVTVVLGTQIVRPAPKPDGEPEPAPVVLPRRLAKTGPPTAALLWLGIGWMLLGAALKNAPRLAARRARR